MTGGGPPPESLTPVEELAFANISGKPIMEEVEGGIKSDPGGTRMSSLYVQGNITLTSHCVICAVVTFSFMCSVVQWRGRIFGCSSRHLQSPTPPVSLRLR